MDFRPGRCSGRRIAIDASQRFLKSWTRPKAGSVLRARAAARLVAGGEAAGEAAELACEVDEVAHLSERDAPAARIGSQFEPAVALGLDTLGELEFSDTNALVIGLGLRGAQPNHGVQGVLGGKIGRAHV